MNMWGKTKVSCLKWMYYLFIGEINLAEDVANSINEVYAI